MDSPSRNLDGADLVTIRRIPEDFRVIEILTPRGRAQIGRRGGSSRWAVYEVTKTSLTTPDAAQRLSKVVGCSWGKIGWAGLKDKHAVTTQVLSVPIIGTKHFPETFSVASATGRLLGWTSEEVSSTWIERNAFEIVVRDLSRHAAEEMESRMRLLAQEDGTLWVTNYFGEQRFAAARHGKGLAGRCLIEGDFEGAIKLMIATPARKDSGKRHEFTRASAKWWGQWAELLKVFPKCAERGAIEALAAGKGFIEAFAALPYLDQQMAVGAYQSHLWNRIAARLTQQLAEIGGWPICTAPDAFGTLCFSQFGDAAPWQQAVVPLPASDMSLNNLAPEVLKAVELALAAEGVQLQELHMKGLRRPAFTSVDRPFACEVRGVGLSPIEPDDLTAGGKRFQRTLKCELGTGSYATIVLRALGQ